jgi:hypothetical protein
MRSTGSSRTAYLVMKGTTRSGSMCIGSRCDQLVCHLLPARRTLSNVDFPVRCDLNAPDAGVRVVLQSVPMEGSPCGIIPNWTQPKFFIGLG